MQRNCGQNSQQILNWFAGEKQTENAGERNMNVKRAVHALIHTDTHSHTLAHTDTYICKWFYCPFVLLLFFLCFPPDFFCLRLLDTLLCIGIIMEPCCVISVNFFCYCQQQFFPNFPNLPGAPSLPPTPGYSLSHLPTLLSHSHSVDICWHHSAHCCRWCFCFVCILLGLFFFTFTI